MLERIQIAKWDREQAAAARGAAERYENSIEENVTNPFKRSTIKVGSSSTIAMAKKLLKGKSIFPSWGNRFFPNASAFIQKITFQDSYIYFPNQGSHR